MTLPSKLEWMEGTLSLMADSLVDDIKSGDVAHVNDPDATRQMVTLLEHLGMARLQARQVINRMETIEAMGNLPARSTHIPQSPNSEVHVSD
jgi:hypothetical protein